MEKKIQKNYSIGRVLLGLVFFVLKPYFLLALAVGLARATRIARRYRQTPTYYKKEFRHRFVYKLCRNLLGLYNIGIKTIGEKNLPKSTALFVANHKSNIDAIALIVSTYRSENEILLSFVAKKELEKKRLIATVLVLIDVIMLDRTNIRDGLIKMEKVAEMLRNGTSVAIFPEGTRTPDPTVIKDFHAASLKPAYQAFKPIVPVVITGSHRVMNGKGGGPLAIMRKKIAVSYLIKRDPTAFASVNTEIMAKKLQSEIIFVYNNSKK